MTRWPLVLAWLMLAAVTLWLIVGDPTRLPVALLAWSGGWLSCVLVARPTR